MGHILSEGPHVNSIVCHPQDEETMVAAEATGWIAYLCKMKPRGVTDLYSGTGRLWHMYLLLHNVIGLQIGCNHM